MSKIVIKLILFNMILTFHLINHVHSIDQGKSNENVNKEANDKSPKEKDENVIKPVSKEELLKNESLTKEPKEKELFSQNAPAPAPAAPPAPEAAVPNGHPSNPSSITETIFKDENENVVKANTDWPSNINNGALLRGFYVFIGLGALVILYIVFKLIRLKRKRAIRKYGILANNDDVVEMTPLGVDDEDEDMTLFEINSHTRS